MMSNESMEVLGEQADTIANLLAAMNMPLPPQLHLIRRRVRWVKQDICNFDRPLSLAIEQAYLQGMHRALEHKCPPGALAALRAEGWRSGTLSGMWAAWQAACAWQQGLPNAQP